MSPATFVTDKFLPKRAKFEELQIEVSEFGTTSN
jgi:hypothetical protein